MNPNETNQLQQLPQSPQGTPAGAHPLAPAANGIANLSTAISPVPVIAVADETDLAYSAEERKKARLYRYLILGLLVFIIGLCVFSVMNSTSTRSINKSSGSVKKAVTNSSKATTPTNSTTKPDATTSQINAYEQSCSDPVTAVTSC